MEQKTVVYRFQQIGNVHRLYIYDEICKVGDFNWETWEYDESDTSAKHFQELLDQIPDSDSIEIYFNSCGGSVDQGTAIFNALKIKPCQKTGIVMGVCHSIAFTILQACDIRVMGQGTTAIIHDVWETFTGNAEDFRAEADNLDVNMDSCVALFMQRAKISEDELRMMMHKETTLSPQLALEYGLIDRIGVEEEPNPDAGGSVPIAMPNLEQPDGRLKDLISENAKLKKQIANKSLKQTELKKFYQLTHSKKDENNQATKSTHWDAFFNEKKEI